MTIPLQQCLVKCQSVCLLCSFRFSIPLYHSSQLFPHFLPPCYCSASSSHPYPLHFTPPLTLWMHICTYLTTTMCALHVMPYTWRVKNACRLLSRWSAKGLQVFFPTRQERTWLDSSDQLSCLHTVDLLYQVCSCWRGMKPSSHAGPFTDQFDTPQTFSHNLNRRSDLCCASLL